MKGVGITEERQDVRVGSSEESIQRISGCHITRKKGLEVGNVVDLGLNTNKKNALDSKTGGPSHICKAQTMVDAVDSRTDGLPKMKAQNASFMVNGKSSDLLEITQPISLDMTKNKAIRFVSQQTANLDGLENLGEQVTRKSMIHRTGGIDKPPDNRSAINVKGRLKVKVTGKKSSKCGIDSNLVNLISGKEHFDVHCLNYPENSKEVDGNHGPTGDCL